MNETIIKLITTAGLVACLLPSSLSAGEMQPADTPLSEDEKSVVQVMRSYKAGIERLSADGLSELFLPESHVFEQGGREGTFANYLEHHLGPELVHFERFQFSDYSIDVDVEGDFALTREKYNYTIVIKADEKRERREINKRGVATSVLKKTEDGWKILSTHSSSRAMK